MESLQIPLKSGQTRLKELGWEGGSSSALLDTTAGGIQA